MRNSIKLIEEKKNEEYILKNGKIGYKNNAQQIDFLKVIPYETTFAYSLEFEKNRIN